MSVRRGVVTEAEYGTVLGLIPFSLDIAMRRRKLDTFRQ
jgi:hypothetical protein